MKVDLRKCKDHKAVRTIEVKHFFEFYVSSLVAIVLTAAIKQNSSVSTVTSSPVFVLVLS